MKHHDKGPHLRKTVDTKKPAEQKRPAVKKDASVMSDEIISNEIISNELAKTAAQSITEPSEPVLADAPREAIGSESKKGAEMSDKLNGEKVFDSFSKLSESFNLDGVKKAAAWYIDTSEKFGNQAIEFQEKATSWAKDTPLAPIFEAQQAIAKKMLERSVSVARNLWQIQE